METFNSFKVKKAISINSYPNVISCLQAWGFEKYPKAYFVNLFAFKGLNFRKYLLALRYYFFERRYLNVALHDNW
jgi:hypothetical protein